MNICIVGTGYVGLVTGTCFAEFGNNVVCVDNDKHKINNLENGILPIYEPGLEDLLAKNVKEGRISFTTKLQEAVDQSLVIFIAVGTPPKEDGSADLQHVGAVAKEVAKVMTGFKVIVNKSTVPVGSAKWVSGIIEKHQVSKVNFAVVSNPEFLREGSAIEDFMRPDRVVIGSNSEEASAIMKDLYSPLYLIETPFVITNPETAELIKYAANAFLATKISFINEIALLCENVGADVHHVALGMGLDRRIGRKFLHPGPGFGGSCFPKDTRALVKMGKEHKASTTIVENVIRVNEEQKRMMAEKIKKTVGDIRGKTLGILGLSFKPNTDDMREAASITIIEDLQKEKASIKVFDPVAMEEAKKVLKDVTYCKDEYEVADGADALIFVTEWNQFRSLDLGKIKSLLVNPVVVDLRNIYEPKKMKERGFKYSCVGRVV
jgi:UDPglucose 6-dehydrogenase